MLTIIGVLLAISISFGILFSLGLISLPFAVSGILAAPLIFVYFMMIGSVLWLIDVNFLLGITLLIFYCVLLHLFRKKYPLTH